MSIQIEYDKHVIKHLFKATSLTKNYFSDRMATVKQIIYMRLRKGKYKQTH